MSSRDDLRERVHASAGPERVSVVLERLAGAERALGERGLDALVAVAGASDSLGDLVAEDRAALEVRDPLPPSRRPPPRRRLGR